MTSPTLTKCLQHTEAKLKKTKLGFAVTTVSSDDLSFTDYDAGDTGGMTVMTTQRTGRGQILPARKHGPHGSCISANRPEKRS
jgi:hypothetical protein